MYRSSYVYAHGMLTTKLLTVGVGYDNKQANTNYILNHVAIHLSVVVHSIKPEIQ